MPTAHATSRYALAGRNGESTVTRAKTFLPWTRKHFHRAEKTSRSDACFRAAGASFRPLRRDARWHGICAGD
jgi:hypothetical protein